MTMETRVGYIAHSIKEKKMYNKQKANKSLIAINESVEGETIEMKIERVVNNGEPIKDGAPLMYTERKDGVRPETNVRTDRWEIATEAMDKVTADKLAKREGKNKPDMKIIKGKEEGGNGEAESTGGQSN